MNKERLNKLADFLATVPDVKFNLGSWRVNSFGKEVFDASTDDAHLRDFDCGTTGCAVGWACSMPEFKSQGLYWGAWGPCSDGYDGWEAVMDFFDLKRSEAEHLFSSFEYADDADGPLNVAARIRKMTA